MTTFLFVEAALVIDVMLGPKWQDVVPIFTPLAAAGMVQPVSATLIWVIISQGRRADLRRWSLIGPALSCAAIAAGLPWGSVGVAVAYAACEIVLRAPLLLWFVTRRKPIGAVDVLSAIAPGVLASAAVFVSCQILTRLASLEGVKGLLVAALTAIVAAAATFFALPSGRRAFADVVNLLREARAGNRNRGEAFLLQKH
jgi:PST family polysaccharide transporter